MKQGWEILPFENCIKKVKYTAKIASSDYLTTGAYPIISQEEEMISGYWDKKEDVFAVSSPVVIFGDHTRVLKYVDFDFVLGADGVKILQPTDCLDAKFLMYFLKSCKIPSLGYSRHYKLLKEISVPVPERAEQERIVGELDCLSVIIAAKRAQLRELDTLAQSIFYTMFGDPITNDKCWQTDVLENVAPQKGYKGVVPSIEEKYWVLNLDMVESNTGEILQKCYFDKESIGSSTNMFDMNNILYSKLRPYLNKVVIPYDIGYATSELVPLCPNKNLLNRIFFAHILRSRFFVNYISAKVAGAKMPRVSMDVFKKFHVILPSLCLQNEFAEKIENIERQKELITKSIKETEDLFNSRMSYYFD